MLAVEDVSQDDWPGWTVMEGNQNSFPVVRVSEPVLTLPSDHEVWKKLGFDDKGRRRKPPGDAQRIAVLCELTATLSGLLSEKGNDLWHRLRDRKALELLRTSRKGGADLRSLKALAVLFRHWASGPNAFLNEVSRQAVAGLSQGRLSAIEAVEQLLVGKGPPRPDGKRPPSTVQLAIDVAVEQRFGPSVYSEKIKKKLVALLPENPADPRRGDAFPDKAVSGIDAFTGEEAELEDKTFPKAELPAPSSRTTEGPVGRKSFPLASMFSEARCNERYGMTDASVFPVARSRGTRIKEAIEFITADERRERTWQHVASGRFETRNGRKVSKLDLLVVYAEDKPHLDAKTAAYFGQGPAETAAKFEVDAQSVCQALRGVARTRPRSRLNLFLIREASKGQAQVVLSESPTVEEVLESAERWSRGATANVPAIVLSLPPQEKGQPVVEARPAVPYPDQVVRLLSYQWVREGASPKGKGGKPQQPNQAVVGPGLSDVLALMLRTQGKWEAAGTQLLSLLLQRLTPLLVGAFGAAHAYAARGDKEPLFDYPRDSRLVALRAVSVLGILLDAFDCRKETYMENAPYLVGQVLALADTIHKDYCMAVRKGRLPNSLIGTSLMRRALDSPAGAVADLAERMLEYLRWAKTAEVPKDASENDSRKIAVFEARKKLRQYQPLAAKLGNGVLPSECTDVMKAQLLLGFLATPPDIGSDEKGKDGGK
ncbi:MAG: hypothetical protein ACNA8S_15755 [Deferrisomatales bacterium]